MKATEEALKDWKSEVVCFLANKVKELKFHLTNVVNSCDASYQTALQSRSLNRPLTESEQLLNQKKQEDFHDAVKYGFSAFANTIQGLKDGLKNGANYDLTKSAISKARHGAFIYESRNACTHDGNPIVNAWADGRFYVSHEIIRINKGEKIYIQCPTEDIRSVVLEFSIDFLENLLDDTGKIIENHSFQKKPIDFDKMEYFVKSITFIPEEIKSLFLNNKDQIINSLASYKPSPIDDFTKEIKSAIELFKNMQARSY